MSTVSFVWLGIMIAAIIFEAITVQLVSVWFAGGALVTAIVTMFVDLDIWAQILIFVAVSLLVMIIARPLINDRLNKQKQPTNADSLVGRIAVVDDDIDNLNGRGCVKVNGSAWTARSADGSVIPRGANVRINKIEGVKLIVSQEV